MRMRKKPNLIPRMERCAAALVRDPVERRGEWRGLMPGCTALRLELGCGKGRFTAETAAANPQVLFIAVERVPDAMIIAMERSMSMGLTNVFFVDADAARLSDYFAPGEVDRIYINFCDPWPTSRHAKRRLTHTVFLERYRQVLAPGGEVHFKTDNAPLFHWSLTQFPEAGFALRQVSDDLHAQGVQGVMTDYEEKFHDQGIPIHRCVAAMEVLPVREGEIRVRREERGDFDQVYDLVQAAFAAAEHSDGTEQALVAALRESEAFIPQLSLVAELEGATVGHIMFTKLEVGGATELALAPLSVLPQYQGRGVGSALVKAGHRIAAGLGYRYALVLGSEGYYSRFGYRPAHGLGVETPAGFPPDSFLVVALRDDARGIGGAVSYPKEFGLPL